MSLLTTQTFNQKFKQKYIVLSIQHFLDINSIHTRLKIRTTSLSLRITFLPQVLDICIMIKGKVFLTYFLQHCFVLLTAINLFLKTQQEQHCFVLLTAINLFLKTQQENSHRNSQSKELQIYMIQKALLRYYTQFRLITKTKCNFRNNFQLQRFLLSRQQRIQTNNMQNICKVYLKFMNCIEFTKQTCLFILRYSPVLQILSIK
eukprot:TRINITY_DN7329_c1_g1_i1.p1 TRINITY_DN7329_c1_g1~~TRINITY_DN7329_c1_g1_i1.p1  ORF type:complete len:204 (-),score=-32.98 TRINITY_DN7329_c1_g1_i1:272-883(-)